MNFPDGIAKNVTHVGNINLTSKLVLKEVLYIPCFKFNLLSVNKLSNHTQVTFTFYPTHCLLQDLKIEVIFLAKGTVIGSLYVVDSFFYNSSVLSNNTDDVIACNNIVNC